MQTEILEFLMDSLDDHSYEEEFYTLKKYDKKHTFLIGNPDSKIIKKFVRHSVKAHQNRLNEIIKLERSYVFMHSQYDSYRNIRGLYRYILDQFLIAYDYSANLSILKRDIHYRIKKFHVKILIIDNFHKIFKHANSHQIKRILFALSQLANELNLSIIAIGNKETIQLLNSNTQCEFNVVELSSV